MKEVNKKKSLKDKAHEWIKLKKKKRICGESDLSEKSKNVVVGFKNKKLKRIIIG